jgi:hypothetical protein
MHTTPLIGLLICAGSIHAADTHPAGGAVPVTGATHAAASPHAFTPAPDIERTWLGVVVTGVPPALAHQLRLASGTGLLVETVLPDSPAAAAGIQRQDVLVRLGDQLLINQGQLQALLDTYADGARASLEVLRQAKEQSLAVVLERRSMPADQVIQAWHMPLPPAAGHAGLPPHPRGMIQRRPDVGHDPRRVSSSSSSSSSSGAVSDGTTQVTWQSSDAGERLEVRDRAGKPIFSGTAAEARARDDLPPLVGRVLQEHGLGLPAPAEIPQALRR